MLSDRRIARSLSRNAGPRCFAASPRAARNRRGHLGRVVFGLRVPEAEARGGLGFADDVRHAERVAAYDDPIGQGCVGVERDERDWRRKG